MKNIVFIPKHISDIKPLGWILFGIYFLLATFIITILKANEVNIGFIGYLLIMCGQFSMLGLFRKKKKGFCASCGTELKENIKFCPKCGKEIKS